ncbi:MAG: site-specific integrase [Caulobacteraceae bacterium]|nr:site-specific integrase [Caulobacteraceae bacterium]
MAEVRRVKLTKRAVDAAEIPAEGEGRVWDSELKGFCLRIYAPSRKSAKGRRVYAVKYRVGRAQRWYTIGEHGSPWTPDQAREAAEAVLHDAGKGIDHQAAKLERRADVTVAQLIDLYLTEGPAAKPSKRASSWAQDKSSLSRHVKPLLGRKIARDLRPADVTRMAQQITAGATAKDEKTSKKRGRAIVRGGPTVASRTVATLSAMLVWGMEHGGLKAAVNPAKGALRKLGKAPSKERFLSSEEAVNLFKVLDAMVADKSLNASHADIFRLLALTGARRSEIAGLLWAEVDLARNRLTLPPARTKSGEKTGERRIPLNSAAKDILVARRVQADEREKRDRKERRNVPPSPYVFPAHRGDGHVIGLQKPWADVRAKAKLGGARIHDLRHSFASFAIADGASLFMVAKALGHADTRVTERYSHLAADALDALSEAAARRMGATSEGS